MHAVTKPSTMTLIQLGPTKKSDLWTQCTSPMPVFTYAGLCPSHHRYNNLRWVLPLPCPPVFSVIDLFRWRGNDSRAPAVDSCASFSRLLVINILDTTEETFAGRILISATDPLKRQLATIRDRGSPEDWSWARVWLSRAHFSISFNEEHHCFRLWFSVVWTFSTYRQATVIIRLANCLRALTIEWPSIWLGVR